MRPFHHVPLGIDVVSYGPNSPPSQLPILLRNTQSKPRRRVQRIRKNKCLWNSQPTLKGNTAPRRHLHHYRRTLSLKLPQHSQPHLHRLFRRLPPNLNRRPHSPKLARPVLFFQRSQFSHLARQQAVDHTEIRPSRSKPSSPRQNNRWTSLSLRILLSRHQRQTSPGMTPLPLPLLLCQSHGQTSSALITRRQTLQSHQPQPSGQLLQHQERTRLYQMSLTI